MSDNEQVKEQSARRTRRSFLVAAAGTAGGYGLYRWINRAPGDEMIPQPLRDTFHFNERVSRAVFNERGLTPTYPLSRAVDLRINGDYGLKQDLVPASYRLQVVGVQGAAAMPEYVNDVTAWKYAYVAEAAKYEGHDTKEAPKPEAAQPGSNAGSAKDMSKGASEGGTPAEPAAADDSKLAPAFQKAMANYREEQKNKPQRGMEEAGHSASTLDPNTPGLLLTLDHIKRLPRQELVTQFKCIEGWSEIVHWAGYRMADFIRAYPPAPDAQGNLPRYVYMETPNGDYYTGYELAACMHPQTLLVTEMSGKPISQAHGAPLRLHMPIKYGYKQIKRIGLIAYTNDRPDDYWTKLGYDWYAGL